MNYFKLICLVSLLLIPFVGCNDDEEDSGVSSYLLTDTLVIARIDDLAPQDGDIKTYYVAGNQFIVIVTSDTDFTKQRESCSGFSDSSYSGITIGDTIDIKYTAENVDYTQTPAIVRPQEINIWRNECINPVVINDTNENECVCISTNDCE